MAVATKISQLTRHCNYLLLQPALRELLREASRQAASLPSSARGREPEHQARGLAQRVRAKEWCLERVQLAVVFSGGRVGENKCLEP